GIYSNGTGPSITLTTSRLERNGVGIEVDTGTVKVTESTIADTAGCAIAASSSLAGGGTSARPIDSTVQRKGCAGDLPAASRRRLTAQRTIISDNHAPGIEIRGNVASDETTVEIDDSTIARNEGGGIRVASTGNFTTTTVTISGTTIAANHSTASGGGLW